jgi:beta-glucosidase/6-phospho-beta-glucosidase/beta-galactosidase
MDGNQWGAQAGPAGTFLLGVSDSAHQSEGGLNGPGQPRNSWWPWEQHGLAEPAGAANEFWERYPEHLDAAVEAGCTAYRTSVEWARCAPAQGVIDRDALRHYARILRACHERGLEPVLALHHFTYPLWLGPDFWLDPSSPATFRQWAEVVADHLAPWCSRWVTINEINAAAIGSYLIGYFPPGRRFDRRACLVALDNMLTAHVHAYDVLHRARPDAEVGTNSYAFWAYDADRALPDLLAARHQGVAPAELDDWLGDRRSRFHGAVLDGIPRRSRWRDHAVHAGLQHYLRLSHHLTGTIRAVYESPHERTVDVAQVSWYDPRLAAYPRLPGRRTATGRRWGPDPAHWEQTPSPEHLVAYLRAIQEPDQPIWILENGLCNAVSDGTSHPRPDGWDRPTYLARHIDALRTAISEGIDVRGYFHWSLFDNYQWGEYGSRFGLRSVDRTDGVRLLELDAMGDDSVGAFREATAWLRAGTDRVRAAS